MQVARRGNPPGDVFWCALVCECGSAAARDRFRASQALPAAGGDGTGQRNEAAIGGSTEIWRIARCGEKERREQVDGYFASAGATFFRSAAKEGKDEPGGPRRSTRRSLRFRRAVILRKLRIARWLLRSKPKQELRFGKDVSPESSSGDQREPRRIPANKDVAPPPLDSPLLDERRRVYERRKTRDERRKTKDERRETGDDLAVSRSRRLPAPLTGEPFTAAAGTKAQVYQRPVSR